MQRCECLPHPPSGSQNPLGDFSALLSLWTLRCSGTKAGSDQWDLPHPLHQLHQQGHAQDSLLLGSRLLGLEVTLVIEGHLPRLRAPTDSTRLPCFESQRVLTVLFLPPSLSADRTKLTLSCARGGSANAHMCQPRGREPSSPSAYACFCKDHLRGDGSLQGTACTSHPPPESATGRCRLCDNVEDHGPVPQIPISHGRSELAATRCLFHSCLYQPQAQIPAMSTDGHRPVRDLIQGQP